jgi:hypothetical protein
MFRPMLIIGVGGSGGKTLRSMKQAIERRLETARYAGGIPGCWQFLQIDTTYDGQDFPAPMLDPFAEFKSVIAPGDDFASILHNMTSRATRPEQQRMMAGWGIPRCQVEVRNGAGQMRGIGRLVGIADSPNTLKAIQNSIQKMLAAKQELQIVANALGTEKPVVDVPQVFIVSSLGGGSGSGMFIDVAELVKRATTEKWAHSSISFLYTAEVFNSLGNGGANIAKNSLGAMNEIMAAKWVALSKQTTELYDGLGLSQPANQADLGFGSKGTFLIGATNKGNVNLAIGADGAGMDEVFLTIGEAMATALTTESIAEWLYQIAFVNVTETEASIDNSGLSPSNAANKTFAAAGMGFGQLTLGADRIVEYVADAMTKLQVNKLLWPEMEKDLLKNGENTASLIEKKADESWPDFVLSSGLDEKGPQDQIIDSLFPDDYISEIGAFCRKILKEVLDASGGPAEKPIELKAFQRRVYDAWDEEAAPFYKKKKEEVNAKAQKWVPAIQDQMRNLCADELNRNGYLVLSNLLARLQEDLLGQVLQELTAERDKFAKATQNFDRGVFNDQVTELAGGLTGVARGANGAFLEKVVKYLTNVLQYQVTSYVNGLAASLVQDLAKYFLEPLATSISEARFELAAEIQMTKLRNGQVNPVLKFPAWESGIMPARYLPRTIERILIAPENYETTYQLYAEKDSGQMATFSHSVGAALIGKKLNPLPGQANDQTLVIQSSPWVSGVRETQGEMGAAVAKVSWNFQTSLEDLARRNRKWLKDIDSSFGKFTSMSIREFVAADGLDPTIRKAREEKFVFELDKMLGLSQPLVQLNDNAMKFVLSVKDLLPASGLISKTTKVPFSVDSKVGKDCVAVLNKYLPDEEVKNPGFAAAYFDEGSNTTKMSAVSTNQASLPAWAFASLTEPILDSAASARLNGKGWVQFWDTRRTRPLTECIPFETEMRRSIITGWFITTIFGLGEISANAIGRQVKVWNSTLQNPGWSHFPNPLLASHKEDAVREKWVLPGILTSAGLAMSEFGKTGNKEVIQAYLLLKYLGREVTADLGFRDSWDNQGDGDILPTGFVQKSTTIRDWVTTGKNPVADRPILSRLQEQLAETPDRATALKKVISDLRAQYTNVWDEMKEFEWHQLPDTWEIREEIDLALEDIYNFVSHLNTSKSSDTFG